MCDGVNKFTDTIDLKLIKDINNKSETFLNKNKAVIYTSHISCPIDSKELLLK